MAPVVPHHKPVISDLQYEHVPGKQCEACPDTPYKILSNRFKHRDAHRTHGIAGTTWEMMTELTAEHLKLVESGTSPGQDHSRQQGWVRFLLPRQLLCISRSWQHCQHLWEMLLLITGWSLFSKKLQLKKLQLWKIKLNQLSWRNTSFAAVWHCPTPPVTGTSGGAAPQEAPVPSSVHTRKQLKGGNPNQPEVTCTAQLPKASAPFPAPFSFLWSFTAWGCQSSGARDNSCKAKRVILSQPRSPNPFSVAKWEAGLLLLKPHSNTAARSCFGCQRSDLQDWSRTALNVPSDAVVLYWSTSQSNALRNRLILLSLRLQGWENIKDHLQKTRHSSLILVYPAAASPLWPFRPRSGNKKLKIRALRNRIFFPSWFYWKTINIGWTPLDVLCPEPLNTKC